MALSGADRAIGDLLVERRLIGLDQYDEAATLAGKWRVSLIDVLLSRAWVKPRVLYKLLAERFGVPFVDLIANPPDETLLDEAKSQDYAAALTLPWKKDGNRTVFATARPGPESVLFARREAGAHSDLVITSKFDILWAAQRAFRDVQTHRAVYDLAERDPEMSAQTTFTPIQMIIGYALVTAIALGLALAPVGALITITAVMALFYLGNFIFKGILVWVGGHNAGLSNRLIEADAALLRDEDLPVYTILVPMFREPEVLPILAHALRQVDYPLAKLDIKLVLEEGDDLTIDAAKALGLESVFEIVRVPPSQPQTKPKACNYALRFARGDLLVIFDAEDKPEPNQLKKVVAAFNRYGSKVACIQCRLNYYNANENWLTRLFTLDYSLWFDLMLPGLEKLNIPIPLGGTSNHFRIDVLRELNAWDPFNVTEDADLGIRLTQKGYRVGLVDSTTYEEANCSQSNWVRQRSRWIKGYMQTLLVHTRRPIHLYKTIGPLGVLGFIFFIGGTMLSGLLNPLFWAIFAVWLVTQTAGFDVVFPTPLLQISLLNLLLGNGVFIYLTMIAPVRRRWLGLVPYALTVFWYWVLLSIAAYKGLWQLLTNPFYWEKTQHGISKHIAAELEHALAATEAAPA
jgi:cellulose synthase/poly-beta-1,6-N-acetylglucosamine synthase-like glycosyltransferase